MAAITILTFCIVLLLLEITSIDRKRVGGSRSARGGRSRSTGNYARSYGVGSYQNVVLSGRIVTGSSPFTSSTWRSAAIMGSIYGGRAYISQHPHERKLPPICTNNKERSPEGRVYGYFICPRESETEDFKFCCGTESREYCCNKTMAQIFYLEQKKNSGTSIGVTVGIVIAIVFIIVVVAYCCKKRKQTDDVIYKLSKKEQRSPQRVPLRPLGGMLQSKFGKDVSRHVGKKAPQDVDLNRPVESFESTGITPQVLPPSYNAATTTGFDAVISLPFLSQQPQSLPPFDGATTYSNGNLPSVTDKSSPSPHIPCSPIDETTSLQSNRPQLPLPEGLPHSTSKPTYLQSSPNSTSPPDLEVSFQPGSPNGETYVSSISYSTYTTSSQSKI